MLFGLIFVCRMVPVASKLRQKLLRDWIASPSGRVISLQLKLGNTQFGLHRVWLPSESFRGQKACRSYLVHTRLIIL